eukprot:4377753-Alexandrium_andersonii.AAC.1
MTSRSLNYKSNEMMEPDGSRLDILVAGYPCKDECMLNTRGRSVRDKKGKTGGAQPSRSRGRPGERGDAVWGSAA